MVYQSKKQSKPKRTKKETYTAQDIYVLKGLEPVRKRPGMYIGSTGQEGLHHLIWEVLDNGIDEFMAGFVDEIKITLLPDNRIKCEDNGRGIPVDKHPQTGKSALETVMTTLHAGAKFGGKAYQVAGGLHGVGVSVVCALSEYLRAEVCREGIKYVQEYSQGKAKTKIKKEGACKKRGTIIIFEPDKEIFKEIEFDLKKILNHLRQQAYLSFGLKLVLCDERVSPAFNYNFYFEGGLTSYIKYLVNNAEPRNERIFYVRKKKDEVLVEIAFQYTKEMECFEESFANNIFTGEGGTHLTGFRGALTRTLNDYARKNGFLKEKDDNLTGNDIREGLVSVVSVGIRDPQFEGQTKAKLGNPEVKTVVESVLTEGLTEFLEKNPQDARAIIENCLLAARARNAAKVARATVLRKGILEGLTLPGKLADCSSKDPGESELYIVEGDSAGGCWSGETKIALTDGRNIPFKELIQEDKQGKKNFCYTMRNDGHIGIAPILNPRMTKKNTEVIKIILDTGDELICTPDHLFRLVDGTYIPAAKLIPEYSIAPLYKKLSKRQGKYGLDGYEMVFDPKSKKWMYTHILADIFNFESSVCSVSDGKHRHHVDFNKLNNNPTNIQRLSYKQHMSLHYDYIEHTLRRPDVVKRSILTKQSKVYREKIRKIMSMPKMREMLSERAKKQWENGEYKQYMVRKFLEFYIGNTNYRERNNKLLYENQKRYWANPENRKKQAEKVRRYFQEHPEKRKELSLKSKGQWQNEKLLEWRRIKTKEQWTPEFRIRRKKAYNRTYLNKSLKLLKEIFEEYQEINVNQYNQERKIRNDKSILKYETICHRFFDNDEKKLKGAVLNYNHRIKRIVKLSQKIDVYDIEVEGTHNFALASGIFVHNSGKMARDRRFQAILPLKGKILNVERARLDKILAFNEIKALIIALGTAIAQDFDINRLRYHRIVIMTDADTDGAHIRTLLLTLFFRYFREIIEKGYLYIAQPPLYKIQSGKRIEYAYTDDDKAEILSTFKKEKGTEPSIQRYKGLGEMNPSELWETTMDPKNRTLLKVTIEDTKEADRIFDTLMGKEVLPRKKFIQLYAKKVKNLDI